MRLLFATSQIIETPSGVCQNCPTGTDEIGHLEKTKKKMKRKLKFTKYIKDSGTNVYYVLTGATPAESDKFLKFSVKEKKFEKGVGCDFSSDESATMKLASTLANKTPSEHPPGSIPGTTLKNNEKGRRTKMETL